MKELRNRAMASAMKLMQTDAARKVMSKPEVQKAMAWAFQTSFKVRTEIAEAKKNIAKTLAVATQDDLKDLKRTLDKLERKVKDLDKNGKAKAKPAVDPS